MRIRLTSIMVDDQTGFFEPARLRDVGASQVARFTNPVSKYGPALSPRLDQWLDQLTTYGASKSP